MSYFLIIGSNNKQIQKNTIKWLFKFKPFLFSTKYKNIKKKALIIALANSDILIIISFISKLN